MRGLHKPVYERRLQELVRQILPCLRRGDKVLDVGCGFGALGRAILDHPSRPAQIEVLGLERVKRGGELIPVEQYSGGTLPYEDGAFDIVILADVLHHEPDPDGLLHECIRVSRRLLIIKDHQRAGWLAHARISLLDWAANNPYGVPCLYRYNTPHEWTECHRRHDLTVEKELSSMRLYPAMYNFVFGGGLQYFAILRVPQNGRHELAARTQSAGALA